MRVSDDSVNICPVLVAGCSSLNELTRPIYSNHTSKVTGYFLKDLHLYFDKKRVSEFLELSLTARAVQDQFTKAWLSAECYKLVTYEKCRKQFTRLLWNDQKQSSIRCNIFQDKCDGECGGDVSCTLPEICEPGHEYPIEFKGIRFTEEGGTNCTLHI